MVAIAFATHCSTSLDRLHSQPQGSITQKQDQVPLFLHVFQKIERPDNNTLTCQLDSPSEELSADEVSVTCHESCAAESNYKRNAAGYADLTLCAPFQQIAYDGYLNVRKDGSGNPNLMKNRLYQCQNASFDPSHTQNAIADGNLETFTSKKVSSDVLDMFLSNQNLQDDVMGAPTTKEVMINDAFDVPVKVAMDGTTNLSQFTSRGLMHNHCFDTISKEDVMDNVFKGKEAIEGMRDTNCHSFSTMKEVTDDDGLDVSDVSDSYIFRHTRREATNDVVFDSSTSEEIVNDDHDAFTMKEATYVTLDTSFTSKNANIDGSDVSFVMYGYDQFSPRQVANFDAYKVEEIVNADIVAPTTREAVDVRPYTSFFAPTVKKSKGYAPFDINKANSFTKGIHEKEIHAVTEHDFVGACTAQEFSPSPSHAVMPLKTGHQDSLEKFQVEDNKGTFNEEKQFVFETDNTETLHCRQEGLMHSRGVPRLWQDLWQFQEETSASDTAPFVSESDYGDVINTVLNIARSLPKNVTLQEHLHPFVGHINHLCGNAILFKLQKERLFVSAFSLFEWMRLHKPCLLDSRSLCIIFTILGDAGMVDRALVLYNNLKRHKKLWVVQVFNALLSALTKYCRYGEALSVFQEMSDMKVRPDNVTFCILMNLAHKSGSGVKVLWQIFRDMEEQKICAGHEVFGVLMKAFCEEGLRDEALKLLSVMEERGLIPNVLIYNILIDAFGKSGMLEEAEGLVSEMKGQGICMSVVTYNILIDAYGNTRNFETAETLLHEMLEKGPEPNVRSYTALIAAYGRHFLSEKAASVFLRMKKNGVSPNAIAYSALIHAYAEDGWHIKAEYAFENMLREGFIPSVETYTSLLHAFRQAGDLEKVKSIWKRMRLERCRGTRATFNVILDACAKQGDYAEARDVIYEFNKVGIKPDRKTYNMLINAYTRGGQHSRAPEILEEMRDAGFAPDSFTYTTLIFSFLRVRDFEQAFKYHEKMCRDNQLPDKFTYRKLRAILDEKFAIKIERNMKAVIGAQRAQHSFVQKNKKGKSFWRGK